MVGLGYRRRTSFLAGLTVAQISEFSLVFMAMGVSIAHVSNEALSLVTLVGLITIAVSTYMITYSHQLYDFCEPTLRVLSGGGGQRESAADFIDASKPYDYILFGLGRYGGTIGRRLTAEGNRVLGIDFSPVAVKRWRDAGLDAIYGDVSDPEFLARLPLGEVKWAVSTISHPHAGINHADARVVLIQSLRQAGFSGRIAVTTHHHADVEDLATMGAALVLEPFEDSADRAIELMRDATQQPRLGITQVEDQQDLA